MGLGAGDDEDGVFFDDLADDLDDDLDEAIDDVRANCSGGAYTCCGFTFVSFSPKPHTHAHTHTHTHTHQM